MEEVVKADIPPEAPEDSNEEEVVVVSSSEKEPPPPSSLPPSSVEKPLPLTFFNSDDMPAEMKEACVNAARIAIKLKTNRERAEYLKKFFDKTYNANGQGKWHCIVGTDFGSYITHESQNFLFFRLGAYYILIFKA